MNIRSERWAAPLVAVLALGLIVLDVPGALAQEEEQGGFAPQILTSDLARRQTTTEAKITVDFVIVDTDRVVEVKIDGQAQKITPGSTVVVRRDFALTKPETKIEVSAKDEAGNERKLSYLVLKPGAKATVEEAAPKLQFFARLGLRYEIDSNPSNDLSTPVAIKGVDVEGVVPDSDQPDTRTSLRALGGITYDKYNAFLGASLVTYGKSDNEQFESTILLFGGGARSEKSGQNAFVLNYLFMDIDLGEFDYSQQHTLTPGYELNSQDSDGSKRMLFAVDIALKDFSRSDQKDATQYALKYDATSLDAGKQDSLRTLFQIGNSNEGFVQSEYTFLSIDQDWSNKWDSGLLFDIGYGLAYRNYENDDPLSKDTPLGDTRVDAPMRLSLGPGFEFAKGWSAGVTARYTFNLSNKQPYTRYIYGLRLDGQF